MREKNLDLKLYMFGSEPDNVSKSSFSKNNGAGIEIILSIEQNIYYNASI